MFSFLEAGLALVTIERRILTLQLPPSRPTLSRPPAPAGRAVKTRNKRCAVVRCGQSADVEQLVRLGLQNVPDWMNDRLADFAFRHPSSSATQE